VKTSRLCLTMAVAMILIPWLGCGEKVCAPVRVPPGELSAAAQELVESDNKFGLKLFGEIVKADPGVNVFISPLSVSMALGMTYNGAGGTTEEAMRDVLEYGDLTGEEINQSYRDIIDLLSSLDLNVDFSIANSIWHREEVTFKEEFLDVNRTYFDAEVNAIDFSSPEAAGTINDWVSDKTNGKIEEIVDDPIDAGLIMFLINAIYFNGAWTYEFDADETYDAMFTLADGSQGPCRMMAMTDTFSYQDAEYFQAVELPYGDGDFSMIILLPRTGMKVDELAGMMTPANWAQWARGFSLEHIVFEMPKFTLEYEISLKDVLTTLGMGVAFDPFSADLTGLYEGFGNAFIDRVKHKTFVKVNEEGTEAAAVTSVGVGATSMPKMMLVNRPFIFVIRDSYSNTILFLGKIVEPVLD
jgi:serine protease inhibitor